jgi:hypothetical protein
VQHLRKAVVEDQADASFRHLDDMDCAPLDVIISNITEAAQLEQFVANDVGAFWEQLRFLVLPDHTKRSTLYPHDVVVNLLGLPSPGRAGDATIEVRSLERFVSYEREATIVVNVKALLEKNGFPVFNSQTKLSRWDANKAEGAI